MNRYFISMIAAAPFALAQLLFLCEPYVAFLLLLAPLSWLLISGSFLLYLIGERRWRKLTVPSNPWPAFAMTGSFFLVLFLVPAMLLQPVLRKVPACCRVGQTVEWEVSTGKVILVLSGKGTTEDFAFTDGYVNYWTGEGHSVFSNLQLKPVRLQYQYYQPYHSGSAEAIRDRLANLGVPAEDRQSVSGDVWSVLQMANDGKPIASSLGSVAPLTSMIDDDWDVRIGGLVWILLLLISFLAIGRMTIPRRYKTDDTTTS